MWVSGEKAHQVSVASRARPTVCAGARSRHVPTRSAKTPRSRITSMTCAIPQSEEQGSSPPGLPSVPYGTISSDDEASSFKASVSNPSSDASVDSENALPPSLPWQRDDIGPGLLPSVATACLGAFLFGYVLRVSHIQRLFADCPPVITQRARSERLTLFLQRRYHSAVINAPLSQIADDLGFAGNNGAKGAVVSVLVAGGFLGGLGIGPLADSRGRRAALAATTIPLTIGTLISAGADSFTAMTLGRLITGVGVGASSQIVVRNFPNRRVPPSRLPRRVAYVTLTAVLGLLATVAPTHSGLPVPNPERTRSEKLTRYFLLIVPAPVPVGSLPAQLARHRERRTQSGLRHGVPARVSSRGAATETNHR